MSWRGENGSSPAQGPIEIKSKFDAEFRRFSLPRHPVPSYEDFKALVERLHGLQATPFILCYTDGAGDLLPINNDNNFWKALDSARPVLRLQIARRGELWEELYAPKDQKGGLRGVFGLAPAQASRRTANISLPNDFRVVSAIIDVDVVPETHRRVKLCKHGSDRPLGFYIRDGTSVRVTPQGVLKVPGIFISRMVPEGLAESTGLLAVNDEVLEVNGIEVAGKSLDQVTDMMVANAANLIITVKPANLANTLSRSSGARRSGASNLSDQPSSFYPSNSDEEDEVKDYIQPQT